MKTRVLMGLTVLPIVFCCANAVADRQFLRSSYNLEDPNGYCLDIPGFGPRMRKDAPITTHTCKYNRPGFSVDEEFELTATQQLRLPEFDLCLAAGESEPGADVFTIKCDDSKAHAWSVHADGRVTPAEFSPLCLTMSREKVFVNSAPANLVPNSSRAVTLESCASGRKFYQSWKWSELTAQETPSANSLRSGMTRATMAGLRAIGAKIQAAETFALYASTPRQFTPADVSVSKEMAYGSGAAQRLQVYSGLNRNSPQNAAPVLLLVHGGAFRRGGLNALSDAATHFAALGYVVVNMTYPLAPDAQWPGGGQSVALAIQWIKRNAKEIKGDPEGIFVLGHSAGAALVAEYTFRPELIDGQSPTVAGAILASPPVILDPTRPDARHTPYYGDISATWKSKQVLGNITRSSIPTLILVAELDPPAFHVGAARLLNELIVERDVATRFRQMRGHNHISYITAIGTADVQAAEEIIDFISTARRE